MQRVIHVELYSVVANAKRSSVVLQANKLNNVGSDSGDKKIGIDFTG